MSDKPAVLRQRVPLEAGENAAEVVAQLRQLLGELQEVGSVEFVGNGKPIAFLMSAVTKHRRQLEVARLCCSVLRILCDSKEGLDAVSACMTVTKATEDNPEGICFMARTSIFLAIANHVGDAVVAESGLKALALLLAHPIAGVGVRGGDLPQAASIDKLQMAAVNMLGEHDGNAAVVQPALRVLLSAMPSPAIHEQIAREGGTSLAAQVLMKHVGAPAIARDSAAFLKRLIDIPGAPHGILSVGFEATLLPILMAVLRRYTDDFGDEASDSVRADAIAVAAATMSTAARLAAASSDVCDRLLNGGGAGQLVAAVRKYLRHPDTAASACNLLIHLTEPRTGSKRRCARLAMAGAVPLVVDMMEAHGADARMVEAASSAFRRLAADAPTRLELSQARPVLLVWHLLRVHLHDSDAVMSLLGECLSSIGNEESTRSVLMDDGAAAGTMRLVVEAARIHAGNVSITTATLNAVKCLCHSYDDFVAAHEAGAFTLAVDFLRELGAEPPVAFTACTALSVGVQCPPACEQLREYGTADALVDVLKRHGAARYIAKPACGALCRLFGLREAAPACVQPALATAMPLLLAAMRDHKEDVNLVVPAAYTVANAARVMPEVVLAAAPVPVLKLALRQHADAVQPEVLAPLLEAIASIAEVRSAKGAGAVAKAKLLPDVVAALEKHGQHGDVTQMSYRTIRALHQWQASGSSGADHFSRHVPALLAAIARSTRHATLSPMTVGVACMILSELAEAEAYRPHFAGGGVIPMLLGILRRYADGDDTVEACVITAATALRKVCSTPRCRELLCSLKGWDLATLAAVLVRVSDADTDAKRTILAGIHSLSRILGVE